jgi:hypothetical protein
MAQSMCAQGDNSVAYAEPMLNEENVRASGNCSLPLRRDQCRKIKNKPCRADELLGTRRSLKPQSGLLLLAKIQKESINGR